jgi:hypothetical protein
MIGLFIFPSGGMCIYHTQLMLVNLTTNEHQNVNRFSYLFNEQGQYKNPFFRGFLRNVLNRFSPDESSYTIPMTQQSLAQNADPFNNVVLFLNKLGSYKEGLAQ